MGKPLESFGAALRARRTCLGLTQREIAERAQVSVRAVRYIEHGNVPRPASLHRLASTVGLNPAVFTVSHVVRIGVLGPLTVSTKTRIPLMQRCLSGLLALHPNQMVGRAEIIEALWAGDPPHSHVHLVHNYVTRIRRLCRVDRVNGGYRLVTDATRLDLVRFDELASAGTASALSDALDLWRGPVLADLPPELCRHPAAVTLHQRRIDAVLAHTDLALRTPDACASPSLVTLAHDEPLHEGLQARLMLVPARSGQQASALGLYERTRERLAAELGIEPCRDLREAHLRVLRQEV